MTPKFELPPNLKKCKNCNALESERIFAICNDVKTYRVAHKKAGGRGQAVVIKKGIAWIEEPFIY